jgi:hypothetical protein
MYTWGYLKDVILSKLDLTEEEALTQNLIGKFPFYANEAITQICAAVKPRRDFAEFVITAENVGKILNMPSDFISFGDDRCYEIVKNSNNTVSTLELHDADFIYHSNTKVMFKHSGVFYISYNARWITFGKTMQDDTTLDIPTDVAECIPSYVASQCYKVDDDVKSTIFRNEFEMFLARLDDTNYKSNKTFTIGGNW